MTDVRTPVVSVLLDPDWDLLRSRSGDDPGVVVAHGHAGIATRRRHQPPDGTAVVRLRTGQPLSAPRVVSQHDALAAEQRDDPPATQALVQHGYAGPQPVFSLTRDDWFAATRAR